MLFVHFGAENNSRSIAGAREVNDFIGRAFGINRDATGASLQHPEVAHAPFGCVVTDQHYAVAGLNSFADEETRCSGSKLAQVCVSVLLLAAVTLNAHRYSCCMTLGSRF